MHKTRSLSEGKAARLITVLTMAVAIFTALLLVRSEAVAQSAGADQKPATAPAGNPKNGRMVYTADGCYECHGREAQGGAGTGPKLGPNPIPFTAFAFQVRSPRDEMPPYTSKVLSDAQLADIYAFVQSLPQPPKADSIPLLK
jgi:mono/diheme cytochrome c family protein